MRIGHFLYSMPLIYLTISRVIVVIFGGNFWSHPRILTYLEPIAGVVLSHICARLSFTKEAKDTLVASLVASRNVYESFSVSCR